MQARTTLRPMSMTLRVLAGMLAYPDEPMRAHLPEMRALLRHESALSPARLAELDALAHTLQRAGPLEAESVYVDLFDRGRGAALHLFEHVHGDSRARGPAMVDLGLTYAAAGLLLVEGELPDYLPVVLEFVSTQPPSEARAFLGEMAHIFNAILGALQQRDSAYASILSALLELAGEKVQPAKPADEEPLDESWAEPPAFDGCSAKGQARPGEAHAMHFIPREQIAPGAST